MGRCVTLWGAVCPYRAVPGRPIGGFGDVQLQHQLLEPHSAPPRPGQTPKWDPKMGGGTPKWDPKVGGGTPKWDPRMGPQSWGGEGSKMGPKNGTSEWDPKTGGGEWYWGGHRDPHGPQ